jgi:hypothetical protein
MSGVSEITELIFLWLIVKIICNLNFKGQTLRIGANKKKIIENQYLCYTDYTDLQYFENP